MKTKLLLILAGVFLIFGNQSFGQSQKFKMEGPGDTQVEIDKTFTTSTEIFPFSDKTANVYGLAVSGTVQLENEESMVRMVLVDKNYREYLIFETYALLASSEIVLLEEICEETAMLNGVKMHAVKLEITGASVNLNSFTFSTKTAPGLNVAEIQKEKKQAQNQEKIKKINETLKRKGMHWVAGHTSVSELSYEEKKDLFGDSNFPPGFEYYSGGVISAGGPSLKSTSVSGMTPEWDWRNRHGQNWVTPVTDQSSCGSCWAFSTVGATEALVNLFYNQQIHPDLSEQDVLSCSGAGSCSGGNPGRALDYIAANGVVDEGAFPYLNSNGVCTDKSTAPAERIKIGGRIDFGSDLYPQTEDDLKRMIIENGPLSGGLFDWNHTMVLVGYKVVEEGDQFFYRDLNLSGYWKTVEAGDPLIGKTVWIFKNSYGKYFGEWGYIYVETPISNMGWTHAIQTPLVSEVTDYEVVCEDKDGDGYYWWGLGEKPATCDCPDVPDGDDSNPALGPLDEFGNCIPLTAPPVAAFAAGNTTVAEGDSVVFSDLTSNNPVSWNWSFEGGTPAVSEKQHPVVHYSEPGVYAVQLIAANDGGADTLVAGGYIAVEAFIPEYCSPVADASGQWISNVQIGDHSHTSGSGGYEDFTSAVFELTAGRTYTILLEPAYSSGKNAVNWAVWIDTNSDRLFDNAEQVFSASGQRDAVAGTFTVPENLIAETRLRVVMTENEPAACGDIGPGEAEDYSVRIAEPVEQPPVAEFEAAETYIVEGGEVHFNDRSQNNPDKWQWTFPGGNPAISNERNPVVAYPEPGEYDVTLEVEKAGFAPSKKIKLKYIVAGENTPGVWCTPLAVNSAAGYIENVYIENVVDASAGGSGYALNETPVTVTAGERYNVELTPSDMNARNFWKIWIDWNGDGAFDDKNEAVLTIKNRRGVASRNMAVPTDVEGEFRMRISMRADREPLPCDDNFNGEVQDYTVFAEPVVARHKSAMISEPTLGVPAGVAIYPNPVDSRLVVQLEKPEEGDTWALYTMTGGKMGEGTITSSRTEVEVREFSPGIYFMVVTNGTEYRKEKIVKR